MSKFDLLVLAIFAVSILIGVFRGAVREITGFGAFFFAAVVAVLTLHVTTAIGAHFIHQHWEAKAAALIVTFGLAYLLARMVGGAVARSVRGSILSGPDRAAGFAFGAARGWVLVGLTAIAAEAIAPADREAGWLATSRTYPLAHAAAGSIRAIAPSGLHLARDTVAPAVGDAMKDDDHEGSGG